MHGRLPVNLWKGNGTYDFKVQNPTYELFRYVVFEDTYSFQCQLSI